MIEYFFFPTVAGTAESEVAAYAKRYLDAHSPNQDVAGAILRSPPDHFDMEALLQHMPESNRGALRRYLTQQVATYATRGQDMMPALPEDASVEISYAALRAPLRSFGVGTIVGIRLTHPVGLLAVFDNWSIDAHGQLNYREPAPLYGYPRVPASFPAHDDMMLLYAVQPGKVAVSVLLELTNYIGQLLGTATGLPAIGMFVKFLTGKTQKAVDDAFGHAESQMAGFMKLLEAHKISLESDLAAAQVRTYKDFMHIHYNDAWLEDVHQPAEPMPSATKDHLDRLRTFVRKVTDDFDNTSDLFTAINLMRVETPSPNPDLHDASEAMYKAKGFFYMANLALTLGRQTFNAQYVMEGAHAASKIAALLAEYSKEYTAYAVALKTAVDDQVKSRVDLLTIPAEMPGDVTIYDHYDPPGVQLHRRACCGGPDCRKKRREVEAHLKQLQDATEIAYRQYLHDQFWGKSLETFEQAVTAMQDNDKKLQALAIQCSGPGSSTGS